jgi:sporulation protein YlmC with PRC-barrel domain
VAWDVDFQNRPAMLSRTGGRMKASALKGKNVVSMVDGVQIGRVEDVLFDTNALRIAALALTTTGGRSILPFAAIRTLRADAVTVESATATQPSAVQADAGNPAAGPWRSDGPEGRQWRRRLPERRAPRHHRAV